MNARRTMTQFDKERDVFSGTHVLTLPMKTCAFSAKLAVRIVFAALMQLSTCYVIAGDNGTTPIPKEIDKPFVRRLDFGRLATPFVDPAGRPFSNLLRFHGTSAG